MRVWITIGVIVLAMAAGIWVNAAQAKTIYKYVDAQDGTVTYTDVPPKDMTNVHRQKTVSRRYDASARTDELVAGMRRLLTHYDLLYSDPVNMRPEYRSAPIQSVTTIGPQVTIARDGPEDPGVCRQLLAYQFGDVGLLGRRAWANEQREAVFYRNRYGC